MSKVTKQNSSSKTVNRSDKTKTTTKSTSSTIHASSKEATAVVKRKIAKENGVHSTDEKKVDKKLSTATKSNSTIKSDKTDKHSETKAKVVSKSRIENGKPVKKVSSTEKLERKSVKKVPPVDKRDQKRSKEKLSSSSDKDSLETKVVQVVKANESPTKSKTVSKRAAPVKASHVIAKSSVAAANTVTAAATAASMAATISTKNVMNQVHNVTVLSPPPVRRESMPVPVRIEIEEPKNDGAVEEPRSRETHSSLPRSRTRTLTLDGNEIVLLRPKPTVVDLPTSTTLSVDNSGAAEPKANDNVMVEIKPPISFEVMLNNETKVKPLEKKSEPAIEKPLPENSTKTSKAGEPLNVDVGVDKSDKESVEV